MNIETYAKYEWFQGDFLHSHTLVPFLNQVKIPFSKLLNWVTKAVIWACSQIGPVKGSSKSAELDFKLAYNIAALMLQLLQPTQEARCYWLLDLNLHQYLQKPQILIEFQNLSFVSGMKVSSKKKIANSWAQVSNWV